MCAYCCPLVVVRSQSTKAVWAQILLSLSCVDSCPQSLSIGGGIILDDGTIKPYLKELADLEAKIAKDKENMSTGERVDTAAAEVMADAEQKKNEIKQYIAEHFAKVLPKKFRDADVES